MARYHIKDDGTPGKCSAATQDSRPKTQAGDSFHTEDLQEALRESERRFEAKLSIFATQSKKKDALEAQASDFVERYEAATMLLGEDPTDAEARQQLRELQDELSAHSRSRNGVGSLILADSRYEEATIAVAKLESDVDSPLEAAKINWQLQEAFDRQLTEAKRLHARAQEREAAALAEANDRKAKRARTDQNRQAEKISQLTALRAEGIQGQLDGDFDHDGYERLRAKAPDGELALSEDLKQLSTEQLDMAVATGKFWDRAGVYGTVHTRTIEAAVDTEKRRRLNEFTVDQLEASGYRHQGGGFYEHPSQPGEQFRLGTERGQIHHLRAAARELGEDPRVTMTSARAIREAQRVAAGGAVDRSHERFELTRDNLPEAWARLNAAGIQKPASWDTEWGSSEKDIWMERQLQWLDSKELLS